MQQSGTIGLLGLPTEIQVRVLDTLSVFDLVLSRRICQDLKTLVDETLPLQYKIECYLAGVIPRDSHQFELGTALNNLRLWRDAAVNFLDTTKYEVDFLDSSSPDTAPHGESVVSRNILAQVKRDGTLLLTQLQSKLRGVPLQTWSIDIRMQPHWFEFDYSQDLLVNIVPWYVNSSVDSLHIRMFSAKDGSRHPLSSQEDISIALPWPARSTVQPKLSICDDHIGVQILSDWHSEFWIWNWKTGELILNLWGSDSFDDPGSVAASFLFLEHQLVLVPTWSSIMQNERMALRAFSYREKLSQRTRFEEAEAAATFQLPELVRRANVLKVEAVGPAFSSQPPPAGLDVPFDFQMSPRLLVVNFALTAAQFDAPLAGYHLFVMSDVIERRCRGAPGHVVPWDRWASEVRLVQKEPLGLVSDGHLFHTRCILPEAKPRPARDEDDERANSNSDEDADREEAVPLVLYDFAPKHLLRFDALAERFDNVEYVHEPSSVTGPRIWKADSIETGSARPFRKIRTPVEICLETSMFSMTEDCVIYGDETGDSWKIISY